MFKCQQGREMLTISIVTKSTRGKISLKYNEQRVKRQIQIQMEMFTGN